MNDDFAEDTTIRREEIKQRVAEVFIEHLGAKTALGTSERYASELASKLWKSLYIETGLYFDRKRDIAALEKIERASQTVTSALDEMSQRSEDALTEACELDVLLDYLASARAVNAAAKRTKKTVEMSSHSRNRASTINEDAIKVVSFARRTWRWVGESYPPKSLNPASPFGRFLADLLQAIEVDANPQAAFRAWKRHIAAK